MILIGECEEIQTNANILTKNVRNFMKYSQQKGG
jgi:hypothetical protein